MSFGDLTFVEMAVNRVADLRMQICQVIGLGEDRFPQGPSREASLGGLLDEKDHFRQTETSG